MFPAIQPYFIDLTGNQYDFGIQRITLAQQSRFIIDAAKKNTINNESQDNSHAIYERNPSLGCPSGIKQELLSQFVREKPVGYCKTIECRDKEQYPKWSAGVGESVKYNCLHCLSKYLIEVRSKYRTSEGIMNFIFKRRSDENDSDESDEENEQSEENKTVFHGDNKFIIQFTEDGLLFIRNRETPIEISEIEFSNPEPGQALCKIYDSIPYCLQKLGVEKEKLYPATIQGRYVCENIIKGLPCVSQLPDYKPSTFLACSVPRGVPGWREKAGDPRTRGQITSYGYCPGCAYQRIRDNESIQPIEKIPEKFDSTSPHTTSPRFIKVEETSKIEDVEAENIRLKAELEKLKQALRVVIGT